MLKTQAIALILAALSSAPLIAQDAPAPEAATPAPPSKAEIEARLAAAFAKYDVGTKGYLTVEEFHTMMEKEEGKADLGRSTTVHAAADADKNGKLSLGEFTGFVTAQIAARAERRPQGSGSGDRRGADRRGQMVAQFEETWAQFDKGAKGYLTQDEFVAMMADIQTKIRIARMGHSDGGGEGAARGRRDVDPSQVEARSRASFVTADADKDGKLTQEELKAQFTARASEMMQRRSQRPDTSGGD